MATRHSGEEEAKGRGDEVKTKAPGVEVMSMAEEEQASELAAAMKQLDADWERRKARVLRSLTETPLDRWLRRRR